MNDPIDPEDAALLTRFLRAVPDCTQEELARRAGRDPSSIVHYEQGRTTPPRNTLELLAGAVNLPMSLLDASLLPAARAARRGAALASEQELADLAEAVLTLDRALAGTGHSAMGAFLAELEETEEPWERTGAPSAADRRQVPDLWSRLEPCSLDDQRFLVETCPELQTWAIAERYCEASAEAVSDQPAQALELAKLARRVAELMRGEPAWCGCMKGYTLLFVSNAERVMNDMKSAGETFAQGLALWRAGAASDPGLLPEWRRLDLEGSLRRDQRRFREAFDLLGRALAAAPPEERGRILLNKAVAFEHQGESGRALATLREAEPLIEGTRNPRLPCVLRFNWITNLCHLGRYAEAEALLPGVHELTKALNKKLDNVRVGWLGAKVQAGLGRTAEAVAGFEEVRLYFKAHTMAYDYALASMDLAVLWLEQGRSAEAHALAEEMVWIFDEKEIHREALAALRLFCAAAEREAATAELARRVVDYLHHARRDPELRFEP